MRDRPTLCIPDDHDVFQGNLWGEGGKPMAQENANCSHHPDPFDATPIEQGISVYYGRVRWPA